MRKQNFVKNFLTDVIPYVFFAVIGFVQIRIFINNLGEEIYSLNQLYIQLFSYISLVEGGVGAIVAQKYFKLFVDDDKEKIKVIYNSSKKMFRKISLLIIIFGFILSFFLLFITNNSLTLLYMQIAFMLYVIRSIIEYLNLSPRFVIQANQKLYKINLITNFYKFVEAILQLILIYYKIDYLLILVISIIIRLIMYRMVNKKIYSEYPWLIEKTNNNLIKITGIGYMYCHKIAGAIYNNVDIILISAKMKPLYVTAYSSINYISRYINDVIYMIGNSLSSGLGNAVYKENEETSMQIYNELVAFFMFAATMCSACLLNLSKSFITVWIGSEYVLDNPTILAFSFLLFISINKRILSLICEVKGLYKETKNVVIIEAILNLIFSLFAITKYGILGVILATLLSYLLTSFWYYPKYIYRSIYKSGIGEYVKIYMISILLFVLSYIFYNNVNIIVNNFLEWVLYAAFVSILILQVCIIAYMITIKPFRNLIKKILLMRRK